PKPAVGGIPETNTLRHDADDGNDLVIRDGFEFGEFVRSAEMLLPIGVANQHYRRRAFALIFRVETPSKKRRDAYHLKEIPGNFGGNGSDGFCPASNSQRSGVAFCQSREGLRGAPHV